MKNVSYEKFSNDDILKLRETEAGVEKILENCERLATKLSNQVFISTYSLEDKKQIALMGIYKAIMTFNKNNETKSSFYTYANTVARNALLNEASKFQSARSGYDKEEKISKKELSLDYERDTENAMIDYIVDETVDIFQEVSNDEWSWMLKFLTQREYECLYSYYVEGKTFEEIGAKHGATKQAARQTVKKATNKIKMRYTEAEVAEMLGL